MVQSSREKMRTVRHQFDYFCKKILHGEKVNYEREMEYRGKHEISFSQLTQEELGRLNSMDEYTAEEEMFERWIFSGGVVNSCDSLCGTVP